MVLSCMRKLEENGGKIIVWVLLRGPESYNSKAGALITAPGVQAQARGSHELWARSSPWRVIGSVQTVGSDLCRVTLVCGTVLLCLPGVVLVWKMSQLKHKINLQLKATVTRAAQFHTIPWLLSWDSSVPTMLICWVPSCHFPSPTAVIKTQEP